MGFSEFYLFQGCTVKSRETGWLLAASGSHNSAATHSITDVLAGSSIFDKRGQYCATCPEPCLSVDYPTPPSTFLRNDERTAGELAFSCTKKTLENTFLGF